MSERAQVVLQVLIVVGVLAAAVFGMFASISGQPPAVAERTFAPPDASLIASTVRSPTPTPAPTASLATLPPPPSPTASPAPVTLQPYSLNGLDYTGVVAPVGTVFVAPFDARYEYVTYQIIDGEFRTGTDVAGLPHFPYVRLFTGDRILTLRPGARDTDTESLLSSPQGRVSEGDPLFRVIGPGPSSWHFRYDATVGVQVLVSLETGGLETLDAAPFIKTR